MLGGSYTAYSLVMMFIGLALAIAFPITANRRRRRGLDQYPGRTYGWVILAGELVSAGIVSESIVALLKHSDIDIWASVATYVAIALVLGGLVILSVVIIASLRNRASSTS